MLAGVVCSEPGNNKQLAAELEFRLLLFSPAFPPVAAGTFAHRPPRSAVSRPYQSFADFPIKPS